MVLFLGVEDVLVILWLEIALGVVDLGLPFQVEGVLLLVLVALLYCL